MEQKLRTETLCIQAGYAPQNGEPRQMPIVQSTTYRYDTTQSVADLFDLKRDGFFYSRLANPTVDVMEKKIAALEGGDGALCFGSGMAAISTSTPLSTGSTLIKLSKPTSFIFNRPRFLYSEQRFFVSR